MSRSSSSSGSSSESEADGAWEAKKSLAEVHKSNGGGEEERKEKEKDLLPGDDREDDKEEEEEEEEEEDKEERERSKTLTLGNSVLTEMASVPRVTITFHGLCFTVKTRTSKNPFAARQPKSLLKDLHGQLRPGEVTAIMGPSGAGKTTLLNVLSGRTQGGKMRGELDINGVPRKKISEGKYARLCAYVTQDDVLFANLNPRETFWFSAQLRLPIRSPNKSGKVQALIEELGLEGCQKTKIGSVIQRGVSGGQRKRVSIGVEMITDPSALFLDEPTSGLDSSTSYQLVETLQKLAAMGRTVVSTIHQPSSEIFFKFNRLILLSQGHIIYNGPTTEVVRYFAQLGYKCPKYTNPAEYIMNLAKTDSYISSKEEGEERVQGFIKAYRSANGLPEWDENDETAMAQLLLQHQQSSKQVLTRQSTASTLATDDDDDDDEEDKKTNGEEAADIEVVKGANFMYRLMILIIRCILMASRNPLMVQARLAQTLFLALLVGFLYLNLGHDQNSIQDRNGALFFIIVNQAMGGLMSMLVIFPSERPVFIREHSVGSYSTLTYYVSKLAAELPFTTIFPCIFSCIVYWMVGFQADASKFFIFVAAACTMANAAQALGLCISAGLPNMEIGFAISPAVFIPLMLLGGFFMNEDSIPWWFVWAKYISLFKWGFQIVAQNEFQGLTFTCKPNQACIRTGEEELKKLGFDDEQHSLWAGFLFLLMNFTVFHIVAYLLLRFTAGRKRA